MAYAKRASRKRNSRFRSRRTFKRRRPTLRRNTYKAVKRVAYKVLQRQSETKYNDLVEMTYQNVDWSSTVLDCMQNIVQGDGAESKRTGNKVSCKGLGVRINIAGNTASAKNEVSFRVLVVRWHNENGIAPGIGQLISGLPPNRFMAPYLFAQNKNYSVIDDTFIKVAARTTSNAASGFPTQYMYNKFFKLRHVCTWDNNNLVLDGGLYVFILSEEDPSYTWKSVCKWETRLYYKDD